MKRPSIIGVAVVSLSILIFGCKSSDKSTVEGGAYGATSTSGSAMKVTASPEDVKKIAEEAYIYGYPLVLMDVTKEQMTNVARPSDMGAPLGQFAHKKSYPDASFTAVVTPNADTLYSSAWLDLKNEPYILSLPETKGRYYLMPMMSAWTDVFASPGSRTNDNKQSDYAIVGPGWKGSLPKGVQEIRSPTNDVWIIGRTMAKGPSDFPAAYTLQEKYRLVPLSAWGTNYMPPSSVPVRGDVDMKTPAVDQVERMSGVDFFRRMAESMRRNPPSSADRGTIAQMVKMGLYPGREFDPSQLSPEVIQALNEGAKAGLQSILRSAGRSDDKKKINGWVINSGLGNYGTNYLKRATIGKVGLGANLDEDAIYYMSSADADGVALNGRSRYALTFAKGQEPPVNAFWSLSMYNSRQFFIKNPIDRYAIGDRDALKYNRDGSLTIYIQNQNPGRDKVSNWLPAPKDNFNLVMRMYWPKRAVLQEKWQPPAIQRTRDFKQLSEQRELR